MPAQLQFSWGPTDDTQGRLPAAQTPVGTERADSGVGPEAADLPSSATEPALFPGSLPDPQTDGPPVCPPLPLAVEHGVFGRTEAGPIEPDEEEVASLTSEHANEMMSLLTDLAAVEDGLRTGRDPRSGKLPRTPETRRRLAERLPAEQTRLREAYADALAVYAEAFGDEAAAALDAWVRREAASTISEWATCAGRVFGGSGR